MESIIVLFLSIPRILAVADSEIFGARIRQLSISEQRISPVWKTIVAIYRSIGKALSKIHLHQKHTANIYIALQSDDRTQLL